MSIALSKFVQFSEDLNKEASTDFNEDIMVKYRKTVEWLSAGMADPNKTTESLNILKGLNDKRIFYLIKICISNDTTIPILRNSFNELTKKLRDPGLFRNYDIPSVSTIMPKELCNELTILLYRASPLIYNVSNIGIILDLSKGSNNILNFNEVALKRKLLDDISKVNATLFKDQIRTLTNVVKKFDDTANGREIVNEMLPLNEALRTLYKITKTLPEQLDFDDTFLFTRLQDFSTSANLTTCKYAIKIILLSPNSKKYLSSIKNLILPLNKKTDENFSSHIVILMEIFRFQPEILDKESTDIVSYLIKEVLLANDVAGNDLFNEEEEEEKDAYSLIDEDYSTKKFLALSCKINVLKLFTNKLRSIAPDVLENKLAKAFTEKTVKLFFYLIASGGELIPESDEKNYPTPNIYQEKLRLMAGLQILKIAKNSNLNEFIKSSDIIKLINLVEDESMNARKTFINKLKDYISSELISIKFLLLIFFTAYEPDVELKMSIKTWINYTFNKSSFKKGTIFERVLPRLIHGITHHPDIVLNSSDEENEQEYLHSLTTAIDYLTFYFDSIANQENFSLLYYLSERIKNYQDKIKEEEEGEVNETNGSIIKNGSDTTNNSEKMYIIAELSQMILLQLKSKKGWQHTAYPGKLNLPNDLFKPFNSAKQAQSTFKTYLNNPKLNEKVSNNIKHKVGKIIYASQTQRQKAQKKLLAHEYGTVGSRNRKRESRDDISDEEDDAEVDKENNDEYIPKSKKLRGSSYESALKKNLRKRKDVDYNEDEEDDMF